MNPELIPLLIVALLMISAGGAEVQTAEVVMRGDHDMTEHRGALIVGDATVTVPADAEIPGPVYVIGGELRVRGTVTGDVTQLSGSLVAEDGAAIEGQLQHIGGREEIADGAVVGERATVEFAPAESGHVAKYAPVVLTTLALALSGAWLSRRRPKLLENVGTAAREHSLVSLTVGGLLSVTFLSVFVFMAFTLVLIPVSLLGLFVSALTVAYGVVSLGYLVGQRLDMSRTGLSTAVGVVAVVALLQVLGVVPVVGDIVAVAVLVTGLGAVVLTYFGLQRFEPALPGYE
ncbi:MAG: polymer-forming cytoskeletal protein [Halobacteriales archaeon]|nr:polymer-forming cytoskeletal protein [Halobacteriales archaeon]